MKYNRQEILDSLRKVRPGIDKNSANIMGMDCFIFMDRRVYSHDDAISLSTPTPIAGSFAVSASEFYNILSKFKAESVNIEETDKGLDLTCGKAKASVLYRKDDVSRRIKEITPKETDWVSTTFDISDVLNSVYVKNGSKAVSDKIGGICINEDVALSTDNSSVARYKLPDLFTEKIWLSPRAVTVLQSFKEIKHYFVKDGWLHFKSKEALIACRRLIDERYPFVQYKEMVSASKKDGISGTFTKEFLETIDRAAIFAKETDGDFVLDLTFNEKSIIVSSESLAGSFEEEVEMVTFCEAPQKIRLSARRFKQALDKWDEIEFYLGKVGEHPVLVLTKDNYTEVLMLYKE